jgi:peptide methionine sulfoxide reductase msrA/msrB
LPENAESVVVGMGCFWGAEKRMAALPGVLDAASGYAGGNYPDATYEKVLGYEGKPGVRNHAEVVRVVFDPARTSLEQILIGFWENHDPTQGDRQGNDRGSNYRSAIYFNSEAQQRTALMTRDIYQKALSQAGKGSITTEIALLDRFYLAEDYHQDYLLKNPRGYCGLGGSGVRFPSGMDTQNRQTRPLDPAELSRDRQLIVFEAEHCPFCELFREQILQDWKAHTPIATSLSPLPPEGWQLKEQLWATPTIVLFEKGEEVARFTGYNGDAEGFWRWLGKRILSEEALRIAFKGDTEAPFSGSDLDRKTNGTYVDPITGKPLFRSDSKFSSGTGWPSFFQPFEDSVTLHDDGSFGITRIEVRSASSGIHLGHVFDDGPPPTGKRYCINSKVMRFVPDDAPGTADKK